MSKRKDYVSNPNVNNHENFQRSGYLATWFSDDEDKPYVILIATKLARLGSLLGRQGEPKNEPISDTFEDLINYCALWYENWSQGVYLDTGRTTTYTKDDNQLVTMSGSSDVPSQELERNTLIAKIGNRLGSLHPLNLTYILNEIDRINLSKGGPNAKSSGKN